MKYKAVFIDMDGTLLTDDLKISEGTKDIIKRLHAGNILVVIVTGRSPSSSLPYYKELGLINNPIICLNGALVIKDDTILYEEVIQKEDCRIILQEARNFKINISLYHHYDRFTEQMDDWIKQEIAITNTPVKQRNFAELLESNLTPNKMLCMGNPEEISQFEDHLKKTQGLRHMNIFKSKDTYLEIVNANTSKARGIKHLIDIYDIHESEIITIGDNYNDIEMLKFAATSIAMGNAPEEVKKFANIVTDTNNRDGIKKALETLLNDNRISD